MEKTREETVWEITFSEENHKPIHGIGLREEIDQIAQKKIESGAKIKGIVANHLTGTVIVSILATEETAKQLAAEVKKTGKAKLFVDLAFTLMEKTAENWFEKGFYYKNRRLPIQCSDYS